MPLARCVEVDTPYQRLGTPPGRRLLAPRMSTCGVTSPLAGAHKNLPHVLSNAQFSCGERIMPPPHPPAVGPWCVHCVSIPSRGMGATWGGGWCRVMGGDGVGGGRGGGGGRTDRQKDRSAKGE